MLVKKKRDGEWEHEGSDQYSNCKMNLTGARTSHQMGKEIGYERWPAIKSDFPQCHLSDSGRGIMTTANESWALVRRWFKSAPPSNVLTQCPVLYPTQQDTTEQRSRKPLTLFHPDSNVRPKKKKRKRAGNDIARPVRGLWIWWEVRTENPWKAGEH